MEREMSGVIRKVLSSPRWAVGALVLVFLADAGVFFAHRQAWRPFYLQDIVVRGGPALVLTSDDWGGVPPQETPGDLDRLADTLRPFHDRRGRPLPVTVYLVAAGPDFARVEQSGYREYFWRFCYADAPQTEARMRALREEGLFEIQFHGREHYNVPLWLDLLRTNQGDYRKACHEGRIPCKMSDDLWAENGQGDPRLLLLARSFIDASVSPPKALRVEEQSRMVKEGLDLIEERFHTRPTIAVAPGYVWDTSTLQAFRANGIGFMESIWQPIVSADRDLRLCRTDGLWCYGMPPEGMGVIVRCVLFEPADWSRDGQAKPNAVENAMIAVRRAAAKRVPIVLHTHKKDYVGHEEAREKESLGLLASLLRKIQEEYPEVVFLTASELAARLSDPGGAWQAGTPVQVERLAGAEKLLSVARSLWVAQGVFQAVVVCTAGALLWCLVMSVRGIARRCGTPRPCPRP
jgi:hypothetical protein